MTIQVPINKAFSVPLGKGAQVMLPAGLRIVDLMLGWEPSDEVKQVMKDKSFGGLGKLINRATSTVNTVAKAVDVDASVFLVRADGTVANRVCFTNLSDSRNGISHSGDNLTGRGEFPDETISIRDLNSISPEIAELHFWVNIFSGSQDFGHVKDCIAAVVDMEKREELCRFNLTGQNPGKSSILIGAISRTPQGWMFSALGEAYNEKRIEEIIRNHYTRR
jgi:stress response protein SCP2